MKLKMRVVLAGTQEQYKALRSRHRLLSADLDDLRYSLVRSGKSPGSSKAYMQKSKELEDIQNEMDKLSRELDSKDGKITNIWQPPSEERMLESVKRMRVRKK